jgi:hypothetical protein
LRERARNYKLLIKKNKKKITELYESGKLDEVHGEPGMLMKSK